MKDKLKAEIRELAQKILQHTTESGTKELKRQARLLYEKLCILDFTEENLEKSFEQVEEQQQEREEKAYPQAPTLAAYEEKNDPEKDDYLPDGTEYNESAEAITEPNTEKIKDILAQMPPETQKMDTLFDQIISKDEPEGITRNGRRREQKDFRNIGVDYDNLPNFEPLKKQEKEPESEKPRLLNDRLKKGFSIGLNERMAFIRHLFEGKTADYKRVVSQLSTFDSREEAVKFIQEVVKPDYKNWGGKEEFEKKFMELVQHKFTS